MSMPLLTAEMLHYFLPISVFRLFIYLKFGTAALFKVSEANFGLHFSEEGSPNARVTLCFNKAPLLVSL